MNIWDGEQAVRFPLAALLRLLSFPYAAAVWLRNRLFDRDLIRQAKLPCPVVSVGNLTVGGTGKTPAAVFLAGLLQERGYRPAVLSRGYGGRSGDSVNIVSDGERVLMHWRAAGDEPVMMAGILRGVPVLTGPRRSVTGRAAIQRFGADVLILDDGFQHRSLVRDVDIVLLDGARPFGNGFLLPRGQLREPPQALRRADVLLWTGEVQPSGPLRDRLTLPSFRGERRPKQLIEASSGRALPVETLRGEPVLAFAGIGYPEAFRRGLTALGAEVVAFRAFPDHWSYRRSDIESLRRLAGACGAVRIVTTEKDDVRLADYPDFKREIAFLRIGMEIMPPGPFAELIFSRIAYGS